MNALIVAAIRCSLMFTAVAALSVAFPAKANLITNGGFETGDFSGWTVFGIDNDVVGSNPFTAPHSGNFQALFGSGSNSITQNIATTPGSSYVISFWLAAAVRQGGSPFVSVNWGGSTVFSDSLTSPFGYTEYTFTVDALSPATQLQFQFLSIFGNSFYLDDISVTPAGVSVPDRGSTVSLLGFALLGVAVLRRKCAAKAASFSSARTTKRPPSPRCASAIHIVWPLESMAETHPQLHRLR